MTCLNMKKPWSSFTSTSGQDFEEEQIQTMHRRWCERRPKDDASAVSTQVEAATESTETQVHTYTND